MQNTELEIKNLWHNFESNSDQNWVLKDINLSLKQGELIGLLGPSGCGKTTLLRMVAGFEKPKRGSIEKKGQIISSTNFVLPPERREIGMVFQDYALFPHLDVWENVCFGLQKKGHGKDRANWLLKLLGIENLKNRYPHELSGGQSQRVALARALAPGNSLVLLDEPFCSLDVEVRSRLRTELTSVLKSCSASALLVTHDPHEALAICDRIAVINNGLIQQFSKPLEIVSYPSNVFVGQFVLQKNCLPISFLNHSYFTEIGILDLPNNSIISDNSICMFDKDSVKLEPDTNGKCQILAKEYRIDHYLVLVNINGFKIRVICRLDLEISIGDKCKVSYLLGKEFLVFPEKIKSRF